ncbi:MAG: DUF417 family protein [Ginsengibacter sp.]
MITASQTNSGLKLQMLGESLIRYTLVIILIWVGGLKFTSYEAEGIKGLVSNSPLLSWTYKVMSVQMFSQVLGVIEIVLGILIAIKPFAPKASYYGSLGAIIMFIITLSFLLTTPGIIQPDYGFPALSPMPGQFIAKDLLLLAAAIFTAGDALNTYMSRVKLQRI